jgi:hypothetical protein
MSQVLSLKSNDGFYGVSGRNKRGVEKRACELEFRCHIGLVEMRCVQYLDRNLVFDTSINSVRALLRLTSRLKPNMPRRILSMLVLKKLLGCDMPTICVGIV